MFKKSGKTQLNTNKLRKKNTEKKINFLFSIIKSKLRTVPIRALREKVANAKYIISILIKYIIIELRKLFFSNFIAERENGKHNVSHIPR